MAPATVLAPNSLKQSTSLDPQEPSFFAQTQLVPPSQQLRVYFSRLLGRELPRRSQLACSAHVMFEWKICRSSIFFSPAATMCQGTPQQWSMRLWAWRSLEPIPVLA